MTTTKARGLLLGDPMVRAVLEGRKTQTRRPAALNLSIMDCRYKTIREAGVEAALKISPYQPGMLLYVREAWRQTFDIDQRDVMEYRAGGTRLIVDGPQISDGEHRATSVNPRWRPSIHMPRWAARLWLRITDVRVQLVKEISTDDLLAEGVQYPVSADGHPMMRLTGKFPPCDYHRRINLPKGETLTHDELLRCHFASLWESIYGPGSWERGDWVWALTFEKTEKPDA